MASIQAISANIQPIRGPYTDSTALQKTFIYNSKLNAYVMEIDIDELEQGCEYSCDIEITTESADYSYADKDVYFYRNFEFITDRSQEDVDRAIQLKQKWFLDALTPADIIEWNAGLKGAINIADITRLNTKIQQISTNYNSGTMAVISSILSIVGPAYYTYAGFEILRSILNKILTWINSEATQYQKSMFNTEKEFYYSEQPPEISSYNYFEAWNDLEKFLLLYFRVLIYDVYVYKTSVIQEFEPEEYIPDNYLFMTSEESESPEVFAVATDEEMIGLI